MPFSLRLDPETEAKIRALSTRTGRSKSSVVREAVAEYAVDRREVAGVDNPFFRRLSPFIGAVATGGRDDSTDTHAKYRVRLLKKHRARRAR